jgi:hypothetical protein
MALGRYQDDDCSQSHPHPSKLAKMDEIQGVSIALGTRMVISDVVEVHHPNLHLPGF